MFRSQKKKPSVKEAKGRLVQFVTTLCQVRAQSIQGQAHGSGTVVKREPRSGNSRERLAPGDTEGVSQAPLAQDQTRVLLGRTERAARAAELQLCAQAR